MATKPAKTKAPATKIEAGTTVADLLKGKAPATPAAAAKANGKLTEDEVIAFLEMQEKGSEILKRARNTVWRKIAAKEPKAELVDVYRKSVELHGWAEAKLAWSIVRKENAPAKEEKVEAE